MAKFSYDLGALQGKSRWLRTSLFDMAMSKKKGHVPSSFSMAEILVALYYGGVMKYNPQRPDWQEKDRLIISKGHGAMAAYPILADVGYFPVVELEKFTRREGILRQYADNSIPGVECVTGSLGHGLGIGAGFSLAAKHDGRSSRAFVVVSDGECYEGSVTEATRFAAHHCLNNLVCVVDRNKRIILGDTEKLLRHEPQPMEKQWESLGWFAQRVDGHSYQDIFSAFDRIAQSDKPSVIIADTIKGKGVNEMEGNINYHNKFPTPEKIQEFRAELQKRIIG